MSVMVVYKFKSEHARQVDDYLRDFTRRTGREIERIDPDTRQGAELCRLYDIIEYPTVIATARDGQLRNIWRGIALPTIDEVSYYVERAV